jgi:hypothetical protein
LSKQGKVIGFQVYAYQEGVVPLEGQVFKGVTDYAGGVYAYSQFQQ